MKNSIFFELKNEELSTIFGGDDGTKPSKDSNLAYDIAYGVGTFFRGLWEFCKTASEYQASLPSHLKK